MKKFLLILCLGFVFTASAQSDQELIDEQIWTPFTQAWEYQDGKAFNKLHTDDILRITSGGLRIGEEYKSRMRNAMKGVDGEPPRKIEFAFDYRQVNGNVAYEMGFYKVTRYDGKGDPYVGRFHVELRKERGVWKICRDYDSDKIGDQPLSSEMYVNLEFQHFTQ